MKKCGHCKQLKPISEFYKDRTRKDGLCCYCKKCFKEKDRYKGGWKKYYKKNKKRMSAGGKRYRDKLKKEVLEAYGGPVCSCCGESIIEFLTVDHINGGGNQYIKQINALGNTFYGWLKRNNFPKGYQILCRNCNWGKHVYGVCPHRVGRIK